MSVDKGSANRTADHRGHKLPLFRRFSYGVGHVLNDLCASMWFTYLLVYYHLVIDLPNATAGLLLLIGQVVDAMCTPVIGYLCDKTQCFYGRRKIWHLIGTICVASSFSFIYHVCFKCENVELPYLVLYYASFIALFQFGWASTQISHLALIPDLTSDKNEQTGLNSIRYGFTVLANLAVSLSMWQLLDHVKSTSYSSGSNSGSSNSTDDLTKSDGSTSSEKINPGDKALFWYVAVGIVGAGVTFSAIFHIGTKEPSKRKEVEPSSSDDKTDNTKMHWYLWFKNPQFYLVAVIYMCTRLIVNVSQVYTPLYVLEVLDLDRSSVAKAPLIIFVSGLLATFAVKYINKYLGRYITYFLGLCIIWAAVIWFQFQEEAEYPAHKHIFHNLVPYGADILLGFGGSILLVTSLSMTADLIGPHITSGAFVFGAMSFTDKLANGIAIQIIQICHPCNKQKLTCCSACHTYYRQVIVYAPGGASVIALIGLILLVIYIKRFAKPSYATGDETEKAPLLRAISPDSCSSCQLKKSKCMCDFPINGSTPSS